MATWTLAKRELKDLFNSPNAYIFLVSFLALSFWMYFSNIFLLEQTTLQPYFSWIPILFIVFVPALTMGSFAEEIKQGTIEILYTLPISDWQIVLGKFLSLVTFLGISLLMTLPLPFVMSSIGDLDLGPVISGYTGAFLLGTSYLAVGLFISALTRNQIIAFLVSTVTLFLMFILSEPIVTNSISTTTLPIIQFLSFNSHFQSLQSGILDFTDVFFFLSITTFFLYLCWMYIGSKRKI